MDNLAESSNSQSNKDLAISDNDLESSNDPKSTSSEPNENEEKGEQMELESIPPYEEKGEQVKEKNMSADRQDLCESDLKRYRVYAAEEDEKELKDAVLKHLGENFFISLHSKLNFRWLGKVENNF